MYAPTFILLICDVSVQLMKRYFCYPVLKTTFCHLGTRTITFKTGRKDDKRTVYRIASLRFYLTI